MRIELTCALAILCGAELAQAQTSPNNAYNGYYQSVWSYNQTAPGAAGYYGYYQNMRPSGYSGYNPTYGSYPNLYYPTSTATYQNYYGTTSAPRPYTYPASGTGVTPTAPGTNLPTSATPSSAGTNTPSSPPASVTGAPVVTLPLDTPDLEVRARRKWRSPDPWAFTPGLGDGSSFNEEHDPYAWAGKQKFWIGAGYTMAFVRPERLSAPLVTAGSQADAVQGAIGQPGTTVLVGNDNLDFGMLSGVRAEVGFFLDSSDCYSLDAGAFYTFQNSFHFHKASDASGNPIIARPFLNVLGPDEAAELDSNPNPALNFSGGASVDATTELWGAELNGRVHFHPKERLHADGLFGFRFVHLGETLSANDQLTPITPNILTFNGPANFVNAPNSLADEDSFKTRNNFYGLQIGGDLTWEGDWFFVNTFAKFGLGGTNQHVNINGTTTLITPTGNVVAQGGVLALPTNIGSFNRTTVGFLPELGLSVGVNLTPHLQLVAGYSFLYWNQVVRPGGQLDHSLNPTLIPSDIRFGTIQTASTTRPVFTFNEESFWTQFLNVGVNLHY
jgi:hypothetical protein